MMTLTNPLADLKAADLMKGPAEVIPATASLREAAHKLSRAGVSGVPVVDGTGRCVGVLSSADFVRWAEGHSRRPAPPVSLPRTCAYWVRQSGPDGKEEFRCTLPEGTCPVQARRPGPDGEAQLLCRIPHGVLVDWQQVRMDELPDEEVSRCMTPNAVTVLPGTPLTEIARMMVDSDIHRVIVVDDAGKPVGVVSGTDVVAAVAALDGARESVRGRRPGGIRRESSSTRVPE